MLTLVNQACSITVCSYRGEVVTMSYLGRCSCCPIVEYLSWHQSTTTSAIYNHCTGEIVRTKVHIIVLCPCLFHRDFNIQRSLRDHYHVLSSASDIGMKRLYIRILTRSGVMMVSCTLSITYQDQERVDEATTSKTRS